MCAVDHRRRGMASRAQVGAARLRQQLGGACAKEVGVGGAEAHHRDVGAEPHHVQPLGVAIDVAWLADEFNTSELVGVSGVNTLAATGTQTP